MGAEYRDLYSKITKAKPQADLGFHTSKGAAVGSTQSMEGSAEKTA